MAHVHKSQDRDGKSVSAKRGEAAARAREQQKPLKREKSGYNENAAETEGAR